MMYPEVIGTFHATRGPTFFFCVRQVLLMIEHSWCVLQMLLTYQLCCHIYLWYSQCVDGKTLEKISSSAPNQIVEEQSA